MESLLIKTVSNTSYINKGENQDLNILIPDKSSSYSYTYTLAKAGSSINQPNGVSTNDTTWYVISNSASTDGSIVQMAYSDDPSTMYVRYKNSSGWTQWNPLSTVPTNHASPRSTYGPASASNFGHVKLTDQLNVSGQAADGVALSASAGAKITEAIGKASGALPVDGLVGQVLTRTDKETPVGEWKDPSFVYLFEEGSAAPLNPSGDYVLKSGDTMTGNLSVHRSSGDLGFFSKNTNTDVELFCGVGGGQYNHGIWSQYLYKWLIHGDKDKNLYVGDINLTNAAAGRKSLQVNINEVCTSTDTNPGSTIGGNWTKVKTIRETKIARVYSNSNLKLLKYNGNTLNIDLPSDFHQSLGCKVNYWPNLGGNWNDGAIVSLIRDNTFSESTSSKTSSVVLTTVNEQIYTVDVYLEYLSDDAIYVWKRS